MLFITTKNLIVYLRNFWLQHFGSNGPLSANT